MSVHACHVDPADRSSRCRLNRRASSAGRRATPGVGWLLVAAWLASATAGVAQHSVLVGDLDLPTSAPSESFDAHLDHGQSVLVDDGGIDVGGSAMLPDTAGQPTDQLHGGDYLDAAREAIGEPWSDPDASSGIDACGDPWCVGGCRPGSCWAVQADALVLWRNNIDGQPLLVGTDGAVALDAADVRTAAAAGPRIGVLRSLGCGRAIEGNYFNVGGIQGTTTTTGIGAPYTAINKLADLPFADIESAEYTTRGQIKSAELNYRWSQGRRIIWLTGFRWVEWNETATVDMQPTVPSIGGNSIQTRAGNDLYGGQFGCRLKFWDLGKWQVGGVGKVGVFTNMAYQQTAALVDGEPFGPIGAARTDVAFFGEVGVNSTLWINRWLAWRAGYNFFWLEGVATAPQQFPLVSFGTDTASINSNGSVFLQGFSTGLEARW